MQDEVVVVSNETMQAIANAPDGQLISIAEEAGPGQVVAEVKDEPKSKEKRSAGRMNLFSLELQAEGKTCVVEVTRSELEKLAKKAKDCLSKNDSVLRWKGTCPVGRPMKVTDLEFKSGEATGS